MVAKTKQEKLLREHDHGREKSSGRHHDSTKSKSKSHKKRAKDASNHDGHQQQQSLGEAHYLGSSSKHMNMNLFAKEMAKEDPEMNDRIVLIKALKEEHNDLVKEMKALKEERREFNQRMGMNQLFVQEQNRIIQRNETNHKQLEENIFKIKQNIQKVSNSSKDLLQRYLVEYRLKKIYETCMNQAMERLKERLTNPAVDEKDKKHAARLLREVYGKFTELQQTVDPKTKPYHPGAGCDVADKKEISVVTIQKMVRGFLVRCELNCTIHTTVLNVFSEDYAYLADDYIDQLKQTSGGDNAKLPDIVVPADKTNQKGTIRYATEVHMKRIPTFNDDYLEICFYCEEEFAEFKYMAFMEECGLDPNDFD